MVDKDKRKFLDEIYFIGEQKEFKELFGKMVNPLNIVKKTDEILSAKRKAYNYAFCSCCEKYGMKNIDNIYQEFDNNWHQSKGLDKEDLVLPTLSGVVFGGLPVGVANAISKFQDRIKIKWYSYIEKTREFAKNLDNGE